MSRLTEVFTDIQRFINLTIEQTIIEADSKVSETAKYLKNLLNPATGLDIQVTDIFSGDKEGSAITLKVRDDLSKFGPEGYSIHISQKEVLIEGAGPAGVFYGVQTLRQLLPVEIESASVVKDKEWAVPCVEIEDYPRFSWRGFMLDVGRHFFDKNLVIRMLDLMALHKMMVFIF